MKSNNSKKKKNRITLASENKQHIAITVAPRIKDDITLLADFHGYKAGPYVRALTKRHLRENKDLIAEIRENRGMEKNSTDETK
jgi:hypothetical protein